MLALVFGLLTACDDSAPPETSTPPPPAEADTPPPAEADTPPAEPPAALPGRLLVVGGTSGAVFVDGESVGHLPMSEPIEVEAGDHELKVLDMKTGRGQELNIHIEAGRLLEIPAKE
jgi:hypothetical protein